MYLITYFNSLYFNCFENSANNHAEQPRFFLLLYRRLMHFSYSAPYLQILATPLKVD